MRLEVSDLARYRGNGDTQALGGAGETAGLDDAGKGREGSKPVQDGLPRLLRNAQ